MYRHLKKIVPLLVRTAIISAVLAAPVLAVPLMGNNPGTRIVAPVQKKVGLGFVLLVSLQRA